MYIAQHAPKDYRMRSKLGVIQIQTGYTEDRLLNVTPTPVPTRPRGMHILLPPYINASSENLPMSHCKRSQHTRNIHLQSWNHLSLYVKRETIPNYSTHLES